MATDKIFALCSYPEIGSYPAGVADNDPHFDLPNALEDENGEPLCLGCHDDCDLDSNGYCDECRQEIDEDNGEL